MKRPIRYVYTVEVEDEKGFIKPIDSYIGRDDDTDRANQLVQEWVQRGWPKDKINVRKSKFQFRGKDIQNN